MAENTRVTDLMEMLANETDPDKIEIIQFDLAEAMGRKDSNKQVRKRSAGGSEMTDKQKKFAALAEPFDKITYADKITGAKGKVRKAAGGGRGQGNYDGDEVLAAGSCKGGGAAIRGTGFTGIK